MLDFVHARQIRSSSEMSSSINTSKSSLRKADRLVTWMDGVRFNVKRADAPDWNVVALRGKRGANFVEVGGIVDETPA